MRVYLDHSSPLHSEENYVKRDRDNRVDTTDRFEEGKMARLRGRDKRDRSDDKTMDATERMSSQI